MPSPLERVLDALRDKGCEPKRTADGQWMAPCPAHDDRRPSLAVSEGKGGRVLVFCHTGCAHPDVMDALGVETSALIVRDRPPAPRKPPPPPDPLPDEDTVSSWQRALWDSPRILTAVRERRGWRAATLIRLGVGFDRGRLTLPHRNAQGQLLNVMRYDPTGRKDPKTAGIKGRSRDLWPAPETLNPDRDVYVVEGEPDALSGMDLGLPTVAVPGSNGWRPEAAQRFIGRRVRLVPDCDFAGRGMAARIEADLRQVRVHVDVIDLDPDRDDGYDLSDFFLDAIADDGRKEARRLLERTV